jgi:hypothetical protein
MNSATLPSPAMNFHVGQTFQQRGHGALHAEDSAGETALRSATLHTRPIYNSPAECHESADQPALREEALCLAENRGGMGVRKLIAALLLIVIGEFLLASLFMDAASSILILDTAILSFGGIVGGIGLLISAIRDMRGCVSVNRRGIQICAGLATVSLAWHEIEAFLLVSQVKGFA